ncbi:hypothetical protein Tco_1183012 [Tanacetum coccineum]
MSIYDNIRLDTKDGHKKREKRLKNRKFYAQFYLNVVIVCHEKVVRIPLEGDEILSVHGERTQGVMKTLMNTKVEFRRVGHGATSGMMRTVVMDEAHASRWMIYFVVLADTAEIVSDAIRFEYCLASSSGWTKSPVLWAEIEESSLIGPELVQETTDKVVLIKEKLKAARDRQKSYADNRRKPLEFEVGDRVMLKVSPWKGVIRFGKKGKLAPRYVGPFEILERVGPVAYRLRLPEELSGIKVDKTLRFVEEPVENSDREVKRLKCSRMVVVKAKWLAVRYLVKVSWNSKCNFELTWVWEDYLKDKYPRFIVWLTPSPSLYEPVMKQLAIKLGDEYGFVIR